MKPECNGKIIFNLVEEYLILNVGVTAGSVKMETVLCVHVDLRYCVVV
jgi:hypothetical protein